MNAPVVVLAPLPLALPRGRERVELQRDHARRAVRESARASAATLSELTKSADDVPLPSNGWHWSLSHSPAHVAGVVSRDPIGVDEAQECGCEKEGPCEVAGRRRKDDGACAEAHEGKDPDDVGSCERCGKPYPRESGEVPGEADDASRPTSGM